MQRVWDLLADPSRLAQWLGANLDKGPERSVRAGRLILFICLPFGIVNHEQIQLIVLSTNACRVTFN